MRWTASGEESCGTLEVAAELTETAIDMAVCMPENASEPVEGVKKVKDKLSPLPTPGQYTYCMYVWCVCCNYLGVMCTRV